MIDKAMADDAQREAFSLVTVALDEIAQRPDRPGLVDTYEAARDLMRLHDGEPANEWAFRVGVIMTTLAQLTALGVDAVARDLGLHALDHWSASMLSHERRMEGLGDN